MKAYSIDLRERVVAAREGRTISEIVEQFNVSESFVKKMLRQHRELGHVEPKGHGGGQQLKLNNQQIEFIRRQVEKHPDWELSEYCAKVVQRYGIVVSSSTMCRV